MQLTDRADAAFAAYRRTGDGSALATVFDLVAPELLLLAHHFGSDAATAEDLVQATFVAAIGAAQSYDPSRPVRPWLFAILANEARREHRRARRDVDATRLPVRNPVAPPSAAEMTEFSALFRDAVQTLSEQHRQVVLLRLVHGLAIREIAHALGRPPGTVKTWLRRGLAQLRRALPAGLAASLAGLVVAERSLAEVRAAVVDTARSARPRLLGGRWRNDVGLGLAASAIAFLAIAAGLGGDDGENAAEPLLAARASTASASAQRAPAQPRRGVGAVGEERRALPRDRAGLAVEVRWADGVGAAGVWLRLLPLEVANPHLHHRWERTTADGRLELDELLPGRWSLRVDRAGDHEVALVAGQWRALRLQLPVGNTVSGRVAGADGPVSIWLSERGRFDRGLEVARTDADGRFALRDVEPGRALCAVAGGRRPGPPRLVSDLREQRLDLRIGRPATTIRGRVTDVAGRAIAGAVLQIDAGFRVAAESVERLALRVPRVLRAAADGRFACDSAPASSRVVLWARAPGFAPWTGHVDTPAPGATATIAIRLHAGSSLHGRAALGGGVTDARVVAIASGASPRDPMLDGDTLAPVWWGSSVRLGDDGGFRLGGLPPGRIEARLRVDGRAVAGAKFDLEGGAAQAWYPSMTGGRITGTVRDVHGNPLAKWTVSIAAEGVEVETDRHGRFELSACGTTPVDLCVTAPGLSRRPAVCVGQVLADRDPVSITVPEDALPRGALSGVVRGPALQEPQLRVEVVGAWHRTAAEVDRFDGRFAVPALPAREVNLVVADATGIWATTGPFTPRADIALGVVDTVAPAAVEVRVADAEGRPEALGTVDLYSPDHGWLRQLWIRDGGCQTGLAPGRYRYVAWGARRGFAAGELQVNEAGTTLDVALAVHPVREVRIEHPYRAARLWLWLSLDDASGRSVWRSRLARPHRPGEVVVVPIEVPPGEHRLTVASAHGLRGEVGLSADSNSPTHLILK